MTPLRYSRPTRLLISVGVASMIACSSARWEPCGDSLRVVAPRNFGRVVTTDGRPTGIYRGGQPARCGELEYLRSLGVRSILKLNDRGLPIDAAEKEQAARLNVHILSIPFSAATIGRPATCRSVRKALAFLENQDNWPVYVHCTAGKDRTGYVVGMYEKLVLGKPASVVMADLHQYGHRGVRSLLMSHIDHELASEVPACATPVRYR